ncbi:DUF2059 domain-containing protein [Dyella sp. 20L07]|uniref:DUF2059 domain-containing protein n=1 Tax=Dyella sp. 20L07 TaxID=3384240 RepID=UPI003D2713E9
MATAAPASEEQVRQLMDVVGVGKMLSQMNSQAVSTLQQSMPCVPTDFWQGYMDANQTQQFIGRLVPVYQRHFTADELEGLLKFYRSPLGQKVINEMPTTMAEANQAGQQWSHDRSQQMISELKQMGSLDANGRCPAKVAMPPAIGAGAPAGASLHESEDGEAEATPAKAAAKAPAKAKAKAPVKKTTKAPVKKTTTPAKAPAKPAAKPAAKPETKAAAPAKAPAPTQSGQ